MREILTAHSFVRVGCYSIGKGIVCMSERHNSSVIHGIELKSTMIPPCSADCKIALSGLDSITAFNIQRPVLGACLVSETK